MIYDLPQTLNLLSRTFIPKTLELWSRLDPFPCSQFVAISVILPVYFEKYKCALIEDLKCSKQNPFIYFYIEKRLDQATPLLSKYDMRTLCCTSTSCLSRFTWSSKLPVFLFSSKNFFFQMFLAIKRRRRYQSNKTLLTECTGNSKNVNI